MLWSRNEICKNHRKLYPRNTCRWLLKRTCPGHIWIGWVQICSRPSLLHPSFHWTFCIHQMLKYILLLVLVSLATISQAVMAMAAMTAASFILPGAIEGFSASRRPRTGFSPKYYVRPSRHIRRSGGRSGGRSMYYWLKSQLSRRSLVLFLSTRVFCLSNTRFFYNFKTGWSIFWSDFFMFPWSIFLRFLLCSFRLRLSPSLEKSFD